MVIQNLIVNPSIFLNQHVNQKQLKNVWEVCDFADEVSNGDLSISKFAVELHSILDGTAERNYLDPETFLGNTYVTDAMHMVVTDSLMRLTNNQGIPISLLDVSFGGGKTHSLVLLYHLFNNQEIGTKFIQDEGISQRCGIQEIPNVRVIAVDGRHITKNTLWGEIANGFGRYEEFRDLDEKEISIKDISKIKSLFDRPTLIMLDEIPQYLSKLKRDGNNQLYRYTLLFLNELASAVTSVKQSRMIITTTAEQGLLEEETKNVKKNMKSFDTYGVTDGIKEALSRSADPIVPVKEKDTYGVMRKRLVKKIDETQRDAIIDEYYQYYDEMGLIFEPGYKEKLRQAYPFHPFLIETLYKRVGTIQEFNKTRGMFNLLGMVLHHIDNNKIACTLVGTGDMQLDRPGIMEVLTAKVNKDFKEVVESDCVQKAAEIDKNRNEKLATRIASTIYMYSLINKTGRMSGISHNGIKLAVGMPGVDLGLVERILDEDIATKFWFIKEDHHEFYFDQKPNLNLIIAQHQSNVTDKDVRDTIMSSLKSIMPSRTGVKPIIWSEDMLDEDDVLRLFVVDYDGIEENRITERMDDILLHKPGGDIRSKQNTIVMLYPDSGGISGLKDVAKLVSAIVAAEKDDRVKITTEYEKNMKARLSDAKNKLSITCIHTYSKICYPNGPKLRLDQISTITETKSNLTDMVIKLLQDKGKTFDPEEKLSSDIIQFGDTVKMTEIHDRFKIDRSRHFILDNKQMFDAIKQGIIDNVFAYSSELKNEDGMYVIDASTSQEISWNGYLIKKDLVVQPDSKPKPYVPPPTPTPSSLHICRIQSNNLEHVLSMIKQFLAYKTNYNEPTSKCDISLKKEDTNLSITSGLERTSEVISLLNSLEAKGYTGKGTLTITSTEKPHNDFKDIGDGVIITCDN